MNSRRAFLVTVPALGVAVKALADERAKIAPGAGKAIVVQGPSFKLTKNNLAHLSEKLYNSPTERQRFLGDPKGFSETLFKAKLDPSELQKLNNVRNMFADGVCCGGCGCSSPAGAELILPAAH